jgi:alanyl-tRNA synthetase
VEGLLERIGTLEGELDNMRSQRRGELAVELAGQATKVDETSLLVASAPDLDPSSLRQLALGVRDRLGAPAVVVAGSASAGKGSLVALVTKDLVEAGVSAATIISEAATALGGGGSRDPELAQAGGPHGDRLDDALELAKDSAERLLGSL